MKTNAQLADDLTVVASEVLMSMRYWQIIVDAEARPLLRSHLIG